MQRAFDTGAESEETSDRKKTKRRRPAKTTQQRVAPLPIREVDPPDVQTAPHLVAEPAPEVKEQVLDFELDTSEARELPPVRTIAHVQPAYERIVQRLLAYRRSARQNVILVTSAVPDEGASTVARNISIALGQDQNERVLLVDANFRSPCQHVALHGALTEGLHEVLTGEASLGSAVQGGLEQGLSLLASGCQPDNPPQLLTQPAFHGAVSALQSQFDWVIIDGPPVTTYPDSSTLAGAAGGAVLVIRAERTRWEVADEAKKTLEQTGVDMLGAVLNRRKYHIPDFIYRRL
jgi:capsular exopolysaccharide synthesis family protein